MPSERLPLKAILLLLGLSLVWGTNLAVTKIGAREMAPVFMSGIRSVLACACLAAWMKYKGIIFFPSRIIFFHGAVVGFIFAAEFGLIYLGLTLSLASHVSVILYTAPFFAALGAHLFLPADPLHFRKFSGLALAFAGVVLLFVKNLGQTSATVLLGDLLVLGAGAFWGGASVYVKKFLAGKAGAIQTLFYHLFFSGPLLLAYALVFEHPLVHDLSWVGVSSLLFQSVIVGVFSYLLWMRMIMTFPVSLLHAFSFFTPVFGVFISGALILGEPLGTNLLAALVLVSLGLVLVNKP
ncbi:MAG: DMT family transporter [Pseudomonadota bacterium]